MTHIRNRRGTSAQWAAANPVMRLGEIGYETDTHLLKAGDGVNAYNDLPYVSAQFPVTSVNGMDGAVVLTPSDIGAAPIDSPVFTGNPIAPTPATVDNDTSVATTAFVKAVLAGSPVLGGNPTAPTPATSDNDTSVATTAFVKSVLAGSPALGGDPTAPTPATADNDTSIATTAFVKAQGYATLASPTFTGDPKAPTPATADNDTSIATTAFVKSAIAAQINDSGWVSMTVIAANGWSAGSPAPQYRREGDWVFFRGIVVNSSGSVINSTIFTMPVGLRNPGVGRHTIYAGTSGNGTATISTEVDGSIIFRAAAGTGNATFVSLDQVYYRLS